MVIPVRDDSKLHRLVAKDKSVEGKVAGNGTAVEFGVVKQVHYEGDLEIQR